MLHQARQIPDRTPHSTAGAVGSLALIAIAISGGPAAAADPGLLELPEVVVSASRVPVPSREVGSAVTVITGAEIERKQVQVLSDVLREAPSVAVSRSGGVGAITQVRIRGAEGNQTLVIIDGVEVNNPSGASEFDFGNLLAADIERIEVLRGPQSALYGSDAIGGVISITTRRGRGPVTASARAEVGSFRTGRGSARVGGGDKRFNFSLGVTGFTTDGVSAAPESQGNNEQDGHRNKTFDTKLGFMVIPNLRLDLFGRLVDSTTESDPQPAVAGIIRTVDGNVEADVKQRLGRAQATYSLFDGAWQHILGVGANDDKSNTFTNGALTFEANGRKDRYDYQSNVFFDTPSFAQASHSVTFLAEREDESQVTRSAFGNSNLGITNYGYVGEYRVSLWDRLFLTGSVRRDDNDIFQDATTWRTTAAYLHDPTGTRLHGSYGTGVKNPTLFELFGFGPNFVPNPALEPEESRGWDVGIEQTLGDGRLVVDVTYFENRISNLIQGFGNTAVNQAGTTKIQGVEVTGRARILDDLLFTGQYTYTNGRDAAGNELVRRARHLASANLAYAFLAGRARLDLGVDYNGQQNDFQFSNFFIDRTTVALDDYVLINVAASYQVFEGVKLLARVENVLDDAYQEVLGFANPGIGAFVGVQGRIELF